MAKEKKKKKVKVDPNIVDYYALYHLTRGADSKELVAQLRKKQGEIKQMMSAGALNGEEVMEKLLEQDKLITAAIKIFKSAEKLEEYNAQLDAAMESGTLNTEAQEAAESALADIEKLFLSGNYNAVIKKCRMSINENGANAKIYNWLAQSYYMTNQGEAAISTVEEFVKAFPTDASALDMGVRYYILVNNNITKAQEFLNKIVENFAESALAVLDQVYIHLAERNTEIAFKEIDDYMSANPTDQEFRQKVSYDMIGFCSRLYARVDYEGNEIAFLTSDEDYTLCKSLTDKASAIYRDPEIQNYVEYTNHMGEVEFNSDNKTNIKWSAYAAFIYGAAGFAAFSSDSIAGGILGIVLAAACAYAAIMLFKVSKRPYWQIYKYELTGEREPKEQIYITIGNIIAGYMRWCFKAAWAMIKFAISLV
jgi:hypothetical protein